MLTYHISLCCMDSIRVLNRSLWGQSNRPWTIQCWSIIHPARHDPTSRLTNHRHLDYVVVRSNRSSNGGQKVEHDSRGKRMKTLDVVETAVLGTAVVSHLTSLRYNSASVRNQQQFLSGCILVSLVLRKLASGLYEKKRESSPTAQAMQRLRNAESAIEDQVKILDVVLRDMDALKTRSRLVGKDAKHAVKQMDQMNALTGDVLRETHARMDVLENKVDDMEGLIGSVHDVVSKQLDLIRDVVQEQKKLAFYSQGKQSKGKPVTNTATTADNHSTRTYTSPSVHDDDLQKASPQIQTTDEWGRTKPSMSMSPPQHASKDGSILFSFDSN